jgi:quinol monooxygenase YgiN
MAITALLELRLKPEAVAGSAEIIGKILAETRSRPGNLGVDVVVDRKDEAHVMVIERWATIEDDSAYREWRTTPEGSAGLAPFGGLLAGAPALTQYDTTDI